MVIHKTFNLHWRSWIADVASEPDRESHSVKLDVHPSDQFLQQENDAPGTNRNIEWDPSTKLIGDSKAFKEISELSKKS